MLDTLDRKSASTPHLAVLDGFRGFAIVVVVWYHVWQLAWLQADVHVFGYTLNFNVFAETGMIGVYLFYFISGFCLFYPYARSRFDERPAQSVPMFFYRRILKIVPSYYFGLVAWSLVGAPFKSAGDAFKEIVTHLFFVQTFFDDTFSGINGVLYTLAVEVQFYVIFPVIAWAMLRRPWFTVALTIAVANLYRMVVLTHFNVGHEIDQLPGCIDLFGTGMFAAWSFRAIATRAPRLARRKALWTAASLLSLGGCFAILWVVFVRRYDPGWVQNWKIYGAGTLAPALVAATVSSLFAFGWWQRALANPVMLFASYISYNLYLWHQWLALQFEKLHVGGFVGWNTSDTGPQRLAFMLEASGLSVFVAWLITIALEQPLLRVRPFQRFFERRRATLP